MIYLPKEEIPQRLTRDKLANYAIGIEQKVNTLFNENLEEYIIQDGPPYANGDLHIGHLLNKTLKDIHLKLQLVKGKKVKFSFGWDCHGLPIENRAKNLPGNLLDNCRDIALKYRTIQKQTLHKFGIYSTETDYLTLNEDFKERELNLFNSLVTINKLKPTWYSPTLNTVLANSEIEYKSIQEESLYFKVKSGTVWLIVWTTTEWTVYGNQAICLNKNIEYVKHNDFVCSKSFAESKGWEFESFDVSTLTSYTNPNGIECPILYDSYVSDTNTGIVHLCGGHGDDDFRILKDNNIEPINACEIHELQNHISNYKLNEKFVVEREVITHDYPCDWREGKKIYKVLTEQTYIEFNNYSVIKSSREIKMSGSDRNRLESMIQSRQDWCVSRQRKWGVQIPNSNDILDVWFDSGSVFTMYDRPSDIYIEGVDQHRGWFQSSIILASLIGKIPTKKIVTHGFVLDNLGDKLAKSKENYKPLDELFEKYNPDVIRLWVILSNFRNEVMFSEDALDSAAKQYFKIRNYYRYFVNNLYINKYDYSNVSSELKVSLEIMVQLAYTQLEQFELNKAFHTLMNFIRNYSSTLTNDLKNEFYEADLTDSVRIRIETEMHYILNKSANLLFILCPFLAMEIEEFIK